MKGVVLSILEALESEPLGPGDLASRLGLPRYRVLGIVHALEELGFVEKIYGRGSYKLYILSGSGRALLSASRRGVELREALARALEQAVERPGGGQAESINNSGEAGEALA